VVHLVPLHAMIGELLETFAITTSASCLVCIAAILISLAKALSSEGGCGNILLILGATTSVYAAAYRCLFKMCIFSMSIIGMMSNAGRHFM